MGGVRGIRKITLTFPDSETINALIEHAKREKRTAQNQAAFMITNALNKKEPLRILGAIEVLLEQMEEVLSEHNAGHRQLVRQVEYIQELVEGEQ